MTDYSTAQELPTSGVFTGMIAGDARVKSGSVLEVRGMIDGDLFIEAGSRVVVSGMVDGRVVNEGSDVELTGMIGG